MDINIEQVTVNNKISGSIPSLYDFELNNRGYSFYLHPLPKLTK